MVKLGYKLSSEDTNPLDLVRYAKWLKKQVLILPWLQITTTHG